MARLGYPNVFESEADFPIQNAVRLLSLDAVLLVADPFYCACAQDDRYDFTYNPEIGYYDTWRFTYVPFWKRWPYCKEVPIMMGGSGLLLGLILGAARVGRGKKRGGGSRAAMIAYRAVAGGIMFGTLLFTSAFVFHCILSSFPLTSRFPPAEANIMFVKPTKTSMEEDWQEEEQEEMAHDWDSHVKEATKDYGQTQK